MLCPIPVTQSGSGYLAHAYAGGDILVYPTGDFAPSRRLPDFKRSLIPAETPAHGEIKVARIVGDGCRDGRRNNETGRGIWPTGIVLADADSSRSARKFLGRIFTFEQFLYVIVGRTRGKTVCVQGKIQHMDFLADFLIDPALGFLPECAAVYQGLQPVGYGIVFVPWIVRQRIAHGLDHMREDIEPHHIGGAESRAFWAADEGPG